MKELSNKNQKLINEAEKIFEQYRMKFDTLFVNIGDKFYGYQPIKQSSKKGSVNLTDERQAELSEGFNKMCEFLEAKGIDVMTCFIALDEGAAIIFVAPKSIFLKSKVTEILQEMEEEYEKRTKIS